MARPQHMAMAQGPLLAAGKPQRRSAQLGPVGARPTLRHHDLDCEHDSRPRCLRLGEAPAAASGGVGGLDAGSAKQAAWPELEVELIGEALGQRAYGTRGPPRRRCAPPRARLPASLLTTSRHRLRGPSAAATKGGGPPIAQRPEPCHSPVSMEEAGMPFHVWYTLTTTRCRPSGGAVYSGGWHCQNLARAGRAASALAKGPGFAPAAWCKPRPPGRLTRRCSSCRWCRRGSRWTGRSR
jgi:hypothetical protein